MKTNDLDDRFIDALEMMFKNKEIEIAVCETTQSESDETDYLL